MTIIYKKVEVEVDLELELERIVEDYRDEILLQLESDKAAKVLGRVWEEVELPTSLKLDVEECLRANGCTLFSKVN